MHLGCGGAHLEEGAGTGAGATPDDASSQAGAVYVYQHDGSAWQPPQYFKAINTDGGAFYGSALALSADASTLAVGAFGESGVGAGLGLTPSAGANDSGAVYMYRYDGSAWQAAQYIKASNAQGDDNFGYAVALSIDGSTLAVGANLEDGGGTGVGSASDEAGNASGAVYLY